MFVLPKVERIESRIANLMAEVEKLRQELAPYEEAKEIAANLIAQVSEAKEKLTECGLEKSDLQDFAIALYSSAFGERPRGVLSNPDTERLKTIEEEKQALEKDRDRLAKNNEELQEKVKELELLIQDKTKELTSVEKPEEKIQPFSNGSEYGTWMQSNCEQCQAENCSILAAINEGLISDGMMPVEFVIAAGAQNNETGWTFPSRCQKFEGKEPATEDDTASPDTHPQTTILEFLRKANSSSVVLNQLKWEGLVDAVGKDAIANLATMQVPPQLEQIRQELLEKVPQLLCEQKRSGKPSPDWVPESISSIADELLMKCDAYKVGDRVFTEEGEIEITEYDPNTGWLRGKRDKKLVSFHQSEINVPF